MRTLYLYFTLCLLLTFNSATPVCSGEKVEKAPARKSGEGDGPYDRLIIRGVTLINSTGAPPVGPVDIVVEKNRIALIRQVGFPGVPIDAKSRPQAKPGDKELNCEGMYLMPGFIDMHGILADRLREPMLSTYLNFGLVTVSPPSATHRRATALIGCWSTGPRVPAMRL